MHYPLTCPKITGPDSQFPLCYPALETLSLR